MIEPTIRREDRDVPIVPSASAHRAPVLKFFGEQRQGHQTEPWPVAGGGPRNLPMPTTRLPSRTRRRGSRDPRGDGPEGRWERWAEASLVCRVPVAGCRVDRDARPGGPRRAAHMRWVEHTRVTRRGRARALSTRAAWACILYPTSAPFLPRFFASSGSSRLGAPQSNTSSFCRSKMNALATKSFNGQALAASSRRTTASARSALVVRAGRIVRRISVHIERIDRVMAHSAIHPLRRRGCRPVAFYHRD